MKSIMEQGDHTIYPFSANKLNGQPFSFEQLRGKVVLVVNTASKCGHDYQLGMLEELYRTYKDRGLMIIGFPSDQFAQEPLDSSGIAEHCSINYGVSFPMMEKIKVRGKMAHPLYQFFADKKANGVLSNTPKWNFYKFLIGRDGKVIDYFWTYRKPDNKKFRMAIEKALAVSVPVVTV